MKKNTTKSKDRVSDISAILKNFKTLAEKPEQLNTESIIDLLGQADTPAFTPVVASQVNTDLFYKLGQILYDIASSDATKSYLEIFRHSEFLIRIYGESRWSELILKLLQQSNYHVPALFRHRVQKYGDKNLFTVMKPGSQKDHTWKDIEHRVDEYRNALFALQKDYDNPEPVAFLCKNSLDMALLDLACLTGGIVNIMIPANSVPAHIQYIINYTKPSLLIVSDQELLDQVIPLVSRLSSLRNIILIQGNKTDQDLMYDLNSFRKLAAKIDSEIVEQHVQKVQCSDLATIMFTSGTTGNPKGIMFSHQNLVFKRFARAMAIPEIGRDDIFLSYLPLYHTFGRWLEMMGSIFWTARYVFMENPSLEAMIDNMQRIKPSVFISIPKKWYQLFEKINEQVDTFRDSDKKVKDVIRRLTGGNLKWGLSAAGHLDVEVFQFFQKYGIELMSGFGMTEATGGITMTPPGQYRPNSLGKALPGIELKFLEDGELLIRGPYVMMGYVNPEEAGIDIRDGWLPTGDIMQSDKDGFIRIIDRKKEIYKNIKGETIAPQKIENYFLELEFVKSVFLVGDHKPFNTLLIYPNFESGEVDFSNMDTTTLRQYFSSVIVSVNQFLSPFERIVDFRILERDFNADKGELTPKGTFKRKKIVENFSDIIESMYRHEFVPVQINKVEIQIPSWFLRERGVTQTEISYSDGRIYLKGFESALAIKTGRNEVQIGDIRYSRPVKHKFNLGAVLQAPNLWLGNQNLVDFTGQDIFNWSRNDDENNSYRVLGVKNIQWYNAKILPENLIDSTASLEGLHMAAQMIYSEIESEQSSALKYLEEASNSSQLNISFFAKEILRRTLNEKSKALRERTIPVLMETLNRDEFRLFLNSILAEKDIVITNNLIHSISMKKIDDSQLAIIFDSLRNHCLNAGKNCHNLFRLMAAYGTNHPAQYKIIRQSLIECQLNAECKEIEQWAGSAYDKLKSGFRQWLGTKQKVAVDIETGEEYSWDNVLIFEEEIDLQDKQKLYMAITESTLIREAIFLFSKGALVRLHDIPPGGVWVSLLGSDHGKSVYRVTVQTRYQGSFDLAVNMIHNLDEKNVIDEIKWLIQSGPTGADEQLVEEFGGYWPEYDLWSEEYIPGETAGKFLRRISRQKKQEMIDRLKLIWPFFVWNGTMAYVKFWLRSGHVLEIRDPSPENIIIPAHDYQTGNRIISISSRRKHTSVLDMLLNIYQKFVVKTEQQVRELKKIGRFKYMFSGVVEALGFEHGIRVLNECLKLSQKRGDEDFRNELSEYINSVEEYGFLPKKLYFAIKRYHRWLKLNEDATIMARATNLSELYSTYELNSLELEYPETRTRFYRETIFTGSSPELILRMEKIIRGQRAGSITQENLGQYISAIQNDLELSEDEVFFLTRLTYPHLSPTDSADLISLEAGGKTDTDVVVQLEDYDGDIFSVRAPVNPKEITRLHQLFINNNLSVQFSPEHKYLIAVNERGQLIGGLFYSSADQDSVHIEKIVVTSYYRKKGVSDGLLNEFFKRMKTEHKQYVTTGFFRPEYFYRFGFTTERKYAGLVRRL